MATCFKNSSEIHYILFIDVENDAAYFLLLLCGCGCHQHMFRSFELTSFIYLFGFFFRGKRSLVSLYPFNISILKKLSSVSCLCGQRQIIHQFITGLVIFFESQWAKKLKKVQATKFFFAQIPFFAISKMAKNQLMN